MKPIYNAIICRYSEIAIKKGNRRAFEKCFINNLRRLTSEIPDIRIKRVWGRIWLNKLDKIPFSETELDLIKSNLPKAFGLESYSPTMLCEPQMEDVVKASRRVIQSDFKLAQENKTKLKFRVRARRGDKKFPLCSKEIELALADIVEEEMGSDGLDVDLVNPDISLYCEIREEAAFVHIEHLPGPGGLPSGSNSPVLALLSGGIDSPVASYLAMKRGCHVDFITFHSDPYTPPESVEKVTRLVEVLNQYQFTGRLYSCNLAKMQKEIRDRCAERFRTVLYRRAMFRVSEALARRKRLFALLTGEAIGQVASQTIVNLNTIERAGEFLVLRPVLGMDKQEIIKLARNIGTYEISKEQVPDSCTVFAPKSPATSAKLEKVLREESRIENYKELLDELLENLEILQLNPL